MRYWRCRAPARPRSGISAVSRRQDARSPAPPRSPQASKGATQMNANERRSSSESAEFLELNYLRSLAFIGVTNSVVLPWGVGARGDGAARRSGLLSASEHRFDDVVEHRNEKHGDRGRAEHAADDAGADRMLAVGG